MGALSLCLILHLLRFLLVGLRVALIKQIDGGEVVSWLVEGVEIVDGGGLELLIVHTVGTEPSHFHVGIGMVTLN